MPEKIKIFIASSAEVNDERVKAILSLTELNKVYPCLHLEPILWEIDMVKGNYPEYNTIQDAINPKLQESNFIIFIFYSRIGKNTLIEFDLAKAQGKKMLVFFKDGFTPKKEHIESYSYLLDFKESLEDFLKISYSVPDDFYNLLYRNLNLYLSGNHPCNEPTNENELILTLSKSNQDLIQLLARKDQEISILQQRISKQQDIAASSQLEKLLSEKEAISKQLLHSEEIIKQQAKDKESLEQQLILQKDKDELKAKALIAVEEGDYAKAEEYLKESAKTSIEEVASTFYELANIKKLQFQYEDALNYYDLAIKVNPENSLYLNEAGVLSYYIGNYKKAVEFFSRSLLKNKKAKKSNTETAILYNNLGIAYASIGEYFKAIELYKKSIAINKKSEEIENSSIIFLYKNLGYAYESIDEDEKSLKFYEKAIGVDKLSPKEEFLELAGKYSYLGLIYRNKKDFDKAIKLYKKSLSLIKKSYGTEHPHAGLIYNSIGLVYNDKFEFDKSIKFFKKSLIILNKLLPSTDSNLKSIETNLFNAQTFLKSKEETKKKKS